MPYSNAPITVALSELAYLSYDQINLTLLNLRKDLRLSDHATDTEGFIASNDTDIYIVIRGTKQLKDWLTNLQTQLTYLIKNTIKLGLHTGFLGGANGIVSNVAGFLSLELNKPIEKRRRVHLCGHSLGAIIATILSVMLYADGIFSHLIEDVYCYGSPRGGDKGFLKLWQDMIYPIYRYEHDMDIVPRMPPKGVYVHLGECIKLYDTNEDKSWLQKIMRKFNYGIRVLMGDLSGESIKDHDIKTYHDLINRCIKN